MYEQVKGLPNVSYYLENIGVLGVFFSFLYMFLVVKIWTEIQTETSIQCFEIVKQSLDSYTIHDPNHWSLVHIWWPHCIHAQVQQRQTTQRVGRVTSYIVCTWFVTGVATCSSNMANSLSLAWKSLRVDRPISRCCR